MPVVPFPTPGKRTLRGALLGAAAVAALGGVALENGGFSPSAAVAATTPSAGPASFADVVDRVKTSVVSVKVKLADGGDADVESDIPAMPHFPPGSPFDKFFKQFGLPDDQDGEPQMHRHSHHQSMAQGSGFFISADGYIVTNNHVVDHATEVEVTTSDGKTLDAKVIGTDPKTDLALLKVKGDGAFPFVEFASQAPRVGDWVIAVGNPFGLGGTVTAGIVSARGRDIGSGPYDDFLQIDAPVNRGNSGGPTFNTDGRSGRRQYRDLLAFRRQRRHRLRDRQRRRQDGRRAAEGTRLRGARLARRRDPAGDAGSRRQPRRQERLGRSGRQGDREFSRRDGRREGRRHHHVGQRRNGRRSERPRAPHRGPRAEEDRGTRDLA